MVSDSEFVNIDELISTCTSEKTEEDSKGPTKQLEILYNQALYE